MRCVNLSVWEHPRSQTGRCWGEDLKLEHVVLSVGVGGGCNTLRNAGRIYGVAENLKGTKCTGNFSDHLPVEQHRRTGQPAHS